MAIKFVKFGLDTPVGFVIDKILGIDDDEWDVGVDMFPERFFYDFEDMLNLDCGDTLGNFEVYNITSWFDNIVCNSDYVDCKKVVRWLNDFSFSCAEIFVEDSEKLIDRFEGDEEVEYDFREEGYIAKTRDIDTPEIAQILVAPDLIYQIDDEDVEDQIVISALHENAHILGIDDEEKAESFAYDEYRTKSRSYVPRLIRKCD